MPIFGRYDSPDFVMQAVQKYPHQRLAACSPDRLLHSPDLHRLHLCHDSISPEGRGGRIVYQPVVLDRFCRLRASPRGHKCIDLCMMTDFRLFVIVYTNRLYSYYTPITVVSLCLDVIHAHCRAQAHVISGFDLVAIFKVSLVCNQWSKSNKK